MGNHRGWLVFTLVFDDVTIVVLSSGFPARDCHCWWMRKVEPMSEGLHPLYVWRAGSSPIIDIDVLAGSGSSHYHQEMCQQTPECDNRNGCRRGCNTCVSDGYGCGTPRPPESILSFTPFFALNDALIATDHAKVKTVRHMWHHVLTL